MILSIILVKFSKCSEAEIMSSHYDIYLPNVGL